MKRYIWFLIIIGILFALSAPILFTQKWSNIDFMETGQIGDTIGGTTAPIIGLLSVLLLFYTLWEQIEFNKKQKEISIDEQFKSTFFNLLQTQRDILERVSGKFTKLGLFVYEEYPQHNNDIKIMKENKEWATVKNKPIEVESRGLEFFKLAKEQLQLIFYSLDSKEYYKGYNIEEAYEAEMDLEGKIIRGCNIPSEIEKEQDILIRNTRKPFRISYINDKYKISQKLHSEYQSMSIEKKIALGYAFFFNNYENIGYYFRHLYRILKFIKMSEDEKLEIWKGKASEAEKENIHNQFKQYAQFIQAQMSIDELLLLFYNSFLFDKAKELIIYYDLLENLTIQNLIKNDHNCIDDLKLKDKKNLFLNLLKNTQ